MPLGGAPRPTSPRVTPTVACASQLGPLYSLCHQLGPLYSLCQPAWPPPASQPTPCHSPPAAPASLYTPMRAPTGSKPSLDPGPPPGRFRVVGATHAGWKTWPGLAPPAGGGGSSSSSSSSSRSWGWKGDLQLVTCFTVPATTPAQVG